VDAIIVFVNHYWWAILGVGAVVAFAVYRYRQIPKGWL